MTKGRFGFHQCDGELETAAAYVQIYVKSSALSRAPDLAISVHLMTEGVLTDIDVKATMKAKLGEEFRPYRILGACNPQLAHRALMLEDKIGTMLPCNVIVQQHADGAVEVSSVDPTASMQAIGNPGQEVQARLKRVVDDLQRQTRDQPRVRRFLLPA